MADRKRLLIIGTAQQCHIENFLNSVDRSKTEVQLLLPERDGDAFNGEKTSFFSGAFHAFFPTVTESNPHLQTA